MKIALIGLPFSGKTTVFNAITGQVPKEEAYQTKPQIGTIKVPDQRLNELSKIFQSQKTTYVEISFVDLPRKKDSDKGLFDRSYIKQLDAFLHVIKFFEDGNPIGDYEGIKTEFILLDLEVAQNILNRLDKELPGKKKEESIEYKILDKCRQALEKEMPLRDTSLTKDEKKLLGGYQFLTLKSEVVIANISEEQIGKEVSKKLIDLPQFKNLQILEFCGKIEAEINQLKEEEQRPFLKDLGITKPAREKTIESIYKALDLVTFFTVVGKEARGWSIPCQTRAVEAAGKIHTDMQRGFIRAEVVNYNDFIECGSMQEAKHKGRLKSEGKDYIVQDGDIINFKFSV